jgi:asparagine synthase (glutamine-hydrolysing)
MCGICGLLARPGLAPDTGLVERMNAAIVHRGPDSGSVDAFGPCVLGNRRLAIVDLATGDQPVANESGEIAAVFNGELYNFRELRDGLAGHEIRGTGDTPVIPHLYEEHGLGFAERLEGMFAIALWDAPRNRLVLARDRLGKKPLLWTQLPDGRVAFASELKALLRIPELVRRVRPQAIDDFLALQYVPGPETALAGVHKVRPGHLLVVEDGVVREHRYWEPQRIELREDEWLDAVRTEVTAAVRRRLVSDVPLGALLSGGIDSSIVVALMAQASAEPVRTFTIGFPDARYDERAYARAVAERYGTVHEEVEVALDVEALVPRLAEILDEPLGDEAFLPQLVVSEAARRHVTVALAGDGGDEAFAGYERYAAVALAERLPAPLARAGAAAVGLLPAARREPRSPLFRAARFLRAAAAPRAERYARLMEVFPYELRRRLLVDVDVRPTAEILGEPGPGLAGLQRLDLETYLPGDLLMKADLASMAASLELRAPLLDHRVVELGLSLPDELKLHGRSGKLALRQAFADLLPPQVAARGKTGFGVPLGRWFREDLRELSCDLLATDRGIFRREEVERLLREHRDGRAEHGHRLWCLLMLELWQRSYLDSEHPPAARAATTLHA